MLFVRQEIKLQFSVGRKDIVGLRVQPDVAAVGVVCVGFFVAVRKEPRPGDGFSFVFVLSLLESGIVLFIHNASDLYVRRRCHN